METLVMNYIEDDIDDIKVEFNDLESNIASGSESMTFDSKNVKDESDCSTSTVKYEGPPIDQGLSTEGVDVYSDSLKIDDSRDASPERLQERPKEENGEVIIISQVGTVTENNVVDHQKDKEKLHFQCTTCPFLAKTHFSLSRHYQSKHPVEVKEIASYTAPVGVSKKKNRVVKGSKNYIKDGNVFRCLHCNFYTTRSILMIMHSDCKHNISCPFCSYRAIKRNHMQMHLKIHGHYKLPIVKCSKCNYASFKPLVTKHMRNKHAFRVANTNIVDRAASLEQHQVICDELIKTNSDYSMYQCDFCSYSTWVRNDLKNHIYRIHMKSKIPLIKCPECEYKSNKVNVTKHARLVHGCEIKLKNKLFQCEFCSYRTDQIHRLNKHVYKVHTKSNRPLVQCSKCDFKSSARSVWLHSRVHPTETNENQCKLCSYVALKKCLLDKHVYAVHTKLNLPLVKCLECDYKSTGRNVAHHFRVVHQIKQNECKKKAVDQQADVADTKPNLHLGKSLKCDYTSTSEDVANHLDSLVETKANCNKKRTRCPYCLKNYSNIESHIKSSHAKFKLLTKCRFCDIEATAKVISAHENKRHPQSSQNDRIFRCFQCSFMAWSQGKLARHRRKHKTNKPILECKFCGYQSFDYDVSLHTAIVHKKN